MSAGTQTLTRAVYAGVLVAHGVTYRQAIAALRFYFARRAMVKHQGSMRRAAIAIELAPGACFISKMLRVRPKQLHAQAASAAEAWATGLADDYVSYSAAAAEWRYWLIDAAMARSNGNKAAAARALGMSATGLRKALAGKGSTPSFVDNAKRC